MIRFSALTILVIVMGYFAVTWFYFGSPHPCGIYETLSRWETEARFNYHVDELIKDYDRLSRARKQTDEDIRSAKEHIKNYTPFECVRLVLRVEPYWQKKMDETRRK
jgi:hypothetical protein